MQRRQIMAVAVVRAMKYLGALIGAVLGLIVFHNFFALLLGAFVGYGFDVNRDARKRQKKVADRGFVDPLFALLGAVAKSDGRVSEQEIAVAERMMQRLQLDTVWRRRAIEAFNRGKQAGFNPNKAIADLTAWTGGHRDLAYPMLDVLADTVLAEGTPNQSKLQLLRQLAFALRISELELMAMLAMKGAAAGRPGSGGWRPGAGGPGRGGYTAPPGRGSMPDPYAVLGLPRSADNASIKRAYRKLISEHHPDRLGNLPDDLRRRAEQRASDINAAYDQIKEQRGIK